MLVSIVEVRVDRTTREVAHGDEISAIDASGRVVAVYPSDVPARDLADDMRILIRSTFKVLSSTLAA